MSNHELNMAREALSNYKPGQMVGLENRLNLNFMATGFGSIVVDNAKQFINNNLVAPFVSKNVANEAAKKLEKSNYASLNKYVIRTPEGVVGPMVPYLAVLDLAMDDLMDIDTRLLIPIKKWLGLALSNPGHVDKLWLDTNIRVIDIDKHIDALAKHYDDKVGDDISFNYLHSVYPKPSDFSNAQIMIADLVAESTKVLGMNIPKLTDEISTLVKKVVEYNDKEDLLEKMPSATAAKLSDLLYHAGREVEFLSIVLFQIKIASTAYQESVDKIGKEL